MQKYIVETRRLAMREITENDYPELCEFLKDEDVMYAWGHAFTDREVMTWIRENIKRYKRDGYSYWAAIQKETGKIIGVCGILREQVDEKNYTGIAYIFGKDYWHQGYAIESAAACVKYALDVLGSKEITAQIRPYNTASRKVAEKLGLQVKKEFVKRYKDTAYPHLLYSRVFGKKGR